MTSVVEEFGDCMIGFTGWSCKSWLFNAFVSVCFFGKILVFYGVENAQAKGDSEEQLKALLLTC